jgi:predicted nucleotidyltransferase
MADQNQLPTEQLDRILDLVREVLGTAVIGVYLHGSAALGELRPRSDIDVLVVSRRPTTRDEKQRLVDRLLAISYRQDVPALSRPIELTIVVASAVRPWRYPPPIDFPFGQWLRPRFERGEVETEAATSPDLACVLANALLGNRPLVGPPPSVILDPVPPGDLVRAMIDELDSLLADLDTDTANVVLTLARIWTTIATGAIRTKDAAADWALARLPAEHRPVLARARAVYLGEREDRWEDVVAGIRPHADAVLREIDAARRVLGA